MDDKLTDDSMMNKNKGWSTCSCSDWKKNWTEFIACLAVLGWAWWAFVCECEWLFSQIPVLLKCLIASPEIHGMKVTGLGLN